MLGAESRCEGEEKRDTASPLSTSVAQLAQRGCFGNIICAGKIVSPAVLHVMIAEHSVPAVSQNSHAPRL